MIALAPKNVNNHLLGRERVADLLHKLGGPLT